jgi:DNA uptake protein ComE-like DNA-binding protein
MQIHIIIFWLAQDIEVILDGNSLNVEPRNINGNTMVPLRAIFETLGAEVNWDASTQTVTANRNDTTVTLTIGNKTAYKNGQEIQLTEPGVVIGGATLVPLRFVAESFGAYVHWNGEDRVISISSDGSQVIYESQYVHINTASKDQLKRIIHIDDVRADEIIRLRQQRKFEKYEDLTRINGIGRVRMEEIRAQGIIKF